MANIKTVLVTGAKGQLGMALQNEIKPSNYRFVFTDIDELNVTSEKSIIQNIETIKPDFIINCSAFTAVDKAEEENDQAALINDTAVAMISDICYQKSIFLIHISTDYVFDGRNFQPYVESDSTNPLSVYGLTKLSGEKSMILSGCNGVIIRTSWLYSSTGSNFVKTILKLANEREYLTVVSDQIGTPTYVVDLAKAIIKIITNCSEINGVDTYHYSNEGVCSWYDFAKQIASLANINCNIMPIKSSDYTAKAQRPFYSVLDKTKIKTDFELVIPYWLESLKTCINIINGQPTGK